MRHHGGRADRPTGEELSWGPVNACCGWTPPPTSCGRGCPIPGTCSASTCCTPRSSPTRPSCARVRSSRSTTTSSASTSSAARPASARCGDHFVAFGEYKAPEVPGRDPFPHQQSFRVVPVDDASCILVNSISGRYVFPGVRRARRAALRGGTCRRCSTTTTRSSRSAAGPWRRPRSAAHRAVAVAADGRSGPGS